MTDWREFFARRGIELAELRPLAGGVINETWLVNDREYVLRHYRRTRDSAELLYELSAIRFLADRGFPTAAVVPADDGALFDRVAGRPAALFRYVPGTVGRARESGRGSADIAAGITVARQVAHMHIVSAGAQFPGRRTERGDPMLRLSRWLADEAVDPEFREIAGAPEFLDRLRSHYTALAEILGQEPDLPRGLAHADVAARNIMFNTDGSVAAFLDFDDCLNSYVLYDLCSLVWEWGRDDTGGHDPVRVRRLVDAYDDVRPRTTDERRLLPDLYAAFLAADGAGTTSWWWRGEGNPRPIADSYSAQGFLDLVSEPGWRDQSGFAGQR
jgi:homoserine kinase type II